MKNFTIGLNIVLIAAVAFLYFKIFAGNKSRLNSSNNLKKDSAFISNNCNETSIAFVELDSLYEKITQVKNRREELEKEQKAIESEFRNGYAGLQNRANEFQKKGAAISQQDAEKFQKELAQTQQEIDNKKQVQTQSLTEKSYKFMDDIQTKLKAFLQDYNKEHKYKYILTTGTGMDYMLYKDESANITNDVIKAMNIKLSEKE